MVELAAYQMKTSFTDVQLTADNGMSVHQLRAVSFVATLDGNAISGCFSVTCRGPFHASRLVNKNLIATGVYYGKRHQGQPGFKNTNSPISLPPYGRHTL
jgi:hypothetical protein